jgi:glyoxalase family protein
MSTHSELAALRTTKIVLPLASVYLADELARSRAGLSYPSPQWFALFLETQMTDYIGIRGIHHVTAIAGGAQSNLDFYTKVLGLRLVKRTVNFDAPDTYHFYYGDTAGSPGSLLTFFPFENAAAGRIGTGMVETTAFAIPEKAFESWMSRLAEEGRDFDGPTMRFGEQTLSLHDPDGLRIDLVAEPRLNASVPAGNAGGAQVLPEHAICHLHSVTICVEVPERTARLLTDTFGYEDVGEEAGRRRFRARDGGPAGIVDLMCQPDRLRGRMGAGTVHHVAFRAHDEAEQLNWRKAIVALGFDVTPVLDRQYFRSIYFREPGGVLFEIATDPPGFTTDETPESLGTALKLPSWLESQRTVIERQLPPLHLSGVAPV